MLDKAKALAPELIRLRRDIHRHPELKFQEMRTAKLVAETLQSIGGIEIRTGVGKTGVVGDIGPGQGPTIDEQSLPLGAAILAETAQRFLTREFSLPQVRNL
jgi:hypothetical protein